MTLVKRGFQPPQIPVTDDLAEPLLRLERGRGALA